MPSLHETQRAIAGALFDGRIEPAAALLADGDLAPADRLGIYRNNLRVGFHNALAIDFPVVLRLVGPDCFRGLTLDYLARHPSQRGDLYHAGRAFADFLRGHFAGTDYPYLADVARLERAICEVLVAPAACGIDLRRLATVAPGQHGELRFALDPTCRLVRSDFPAVRIWQSNQVQDRLPDPVDLGAGGDRVLVRRGPEEIEFHVLDAAEADFVAALDEGGRLAAALDAALAVDPAFDLSAALRRLVSIQALREPPRFDEGAPRHCEPAKESP